MSARPPLRFPRVIGHRGAAGLAPENTLAGFRAAAALGVAWVEFDVRLTRDGGCAVIHDATLERTGGIRGRVGLRRLADLARVDVGRWFAPRFAGERLPALDEALALIAELGLGANVELKAVRGREGALARAASAAIARGWPADRPAPLVSSFSRRALIAARRASPGLPLGLLARRLPPGWRAFCRRLGCVSVHLRESAVTADAIAAVHAEGLLAAAYTVNEPARAAALWAMGLDALFSDFPDRLLGAGAERRRR